MSVPRKSRIAILMGEEIPQQPIEDDVKDVVDLVRNMPVRQRAEVFRKLSKVPTASSYYKARFAEQILPDLIAMSTEKCHLQYDYTDYPQWQKDTLASYVRESFNYAAELLDDGENTLKQLREKTVVCMTKTGIVIRFKAEIGRLDLKARRVVPEKDTEMEIVPPEVAKEIGISKEEELLLAYKQLTKDYRAWIERNDLKEGERFERSGLELTPAQVSQLNTTFEPLDDFGAVVKKDRIVIMKLKTPEIPI